MCSDSRGIEWLFEKRGSESFDLISKSRKRLWWVSKSHFRVILRLGVSKLETRVSQSRIYHSIPLIVVCELESGKNKTDERKTGERTVPSLSPHAQTPRCFFCMLTSLCPAFPQSERLEKIARRFFPLGFFTLTPNREPVHRLPGKRKWTLNRIWVVYYFSLKLIEWLGSWPWDAWASVPSISRCWSREPAFARRKKQGRL